MSIPDGGYHGQTAYLRGSVSSQEAERILFLDASPAAFPDLGVSVGSLRLKSRTQDGRCRHDIFIP